LVFLDETWVKTNMAALRGWGTRGQRLVGCVPQGHWRTLTFIAALRHDRVEAPWVLDRPLSGAVFRLDVERILVPTLRAGDVVVLDNLGSHKQVAVRQAQRYDIPQSIACARSAMMSSASSRPTEKRNTPSAAQSE
jgi:DDE superfamily endonuclease